MNSDLEAYCRKWLQKANEDAASVIKLSNTEEDFKFFKATIGFHCQQSIEKYLKAFLVFKNYEFPRTHDLEVIQKMCIVNGFVELEKFQFGGLTDFAVNNRYPDEYEDPTPDEMKNYIQLVEGIKSLVESKIKFQTP
jgi:HEPN domain-containing protein